MPSCVVKACKNNSKSHKKSHGITFHTFPINTESKSKWIAAIRNSRNDQKWLPSKTSVVCSDHFDKNDLYTTNRGLQRVIKSRYPKKMLCPSSNGIAENSVSQSSASTFVQDFVPDLPDVAIDDNMALTISKLPDLPNVAVDFTVIPSSSSAFAPVLPVSPGMSNRTDEEELTVDTPREYKLRQKLNSKDKILRIYKKKIKTLQQTVRRLKNRNKSLKDILSTLKMRY